MRVALVGSREGLDRLRSQLDESIEIAGEFPTLAAGRAAGLAVDGLLVAPDRVRDTDELVEPLTPREIDVLERLAEGLANKAIAAQLGISDQTVKFHVAAITSKLGTTNRTETVRHALRRGLIAI